MSDEARVKPNRREVQTTLVTNLLPMDNENHWKSLAEKLYSNNQWTVIDEVIEVKRTVKLDLDELEQVLFRQIGEEAMNQDAEIELMEGQTYLLDATGNPAGRGLWPEEIKELVDNPTKYDQLLTKVTA